MNINHCTQVGSTTKMSLPPASNNEQIQIPRAPAAPIAAHIAEAPPVHAVDVPPNPEVGQVQAPDLSALLKRVETFETQSRPDISTHMRQLSSYGLRSEADFDKYHAVTLAEAAAVEAHRAADPKAYFLDAACQTLRSSLSRPTDRFKAYFLALFSDKVYTKILDSIAKVESV